MHTQGQEIQDFQNLETKIPRPKGDWAKKVHETWQIDAKERIVLADGSQGCWLTIIDEKSGATLAIERIALGYKFKTVCTPVIAKGAITEEIINQCFELGGTIAGGCQMGIY